MGQYLRVGVPDPKTFALRHFPWSQMGQTWSKRFAQIGAGHHGPVYAIARSPFFPKFLVSVGDWTARIWNEDLKLPIITSKYNQVHLTSAKWSPTRCSPPPSSPPTASTCPHIFKGADSITAPLSVIPQPPAQLTTRKFSGQPDES